MTANPTSIVALVPASWWIGFHVLAASLLLADLSGLRRDPCTSLHKALRWAVVWLSFALVLGVLLFLHFGRDLAAQFAAGYLLEQTLSVDNLFLFIVIFRAFQVPAEQQHRVLTWGVLGAIAMRAAFLLGGLRLLEHFHSVTYLFGGIVLVSGLLMLRKRTGQDDAPAWLRWLLRHLPVAGESQDASFFSPTAAGMRMTPLFLALIAIELTDVAFALDSIPAVLSISRHAFVVYTSNILAVLSLRSLFPAVVEAMRRFWLLHWGVALILVFVGGKMLASAWINISPLQSLAVIAFILAGSMGLSLLRPVRTAQASR
jgi:tellurite resistance protein TerC